MTGTRGLIWRSDGDKGEEKKDGAAKTRDTESEGNMTSSRQSTEERKER